MNCVNCEQEKKKRKVKLFLTLRLKILKICEIM
jgi:hypothetical protein